MYSTSAVIVTHDLQDKRALYLLSRRHAASQPCHHRQSNVGPLRSTLVVARQDRYGDRTGDCFGGHKNGEVPQKLHRRVISGLWGIGGRGCTAKRRKSLRGATAVMRGSAGLKCSHAEEVANTGFCQCLCAYVCHSTLNLNLKGLCSLVWRGDSSFSLANRDIVLLRKSSHSAARTLIRYEEYMWGIFTGV